MFTAAPSRTVCKYYERGECKHGPSGKENGGCKHNHPSTPCRDLKAGFCGKHDECHFFHECGKGRTWYKVAGYCPHSPAKENKPVANNNNQQLVAHQSGRIDPNGTLASIFACGNGAIQKALLVAPKKGVESLQSITYTKTIAEPVKVKTRCPLQVKLLIDESGSMSGSRWRECLGAIRGILPEFKEGDWVGLTTFGESILKRFQAVTPKGKAKDFIDVKEINKLERFIDDLERAGVTGSSTALYSSIIEEVRRFKTYEKIPNLQQILVIVTDGSDNSSRMTPEMVNEFLHNIEEKTANLNLTVIILPIGIAESDEEEMKKMIRGAPCSKEFPKGRPRLGDLHSVKDATVLKSIFTTEIRKIMKTEKQTVRIAHDRHGNLSISTETTASGGGGGSHHNGSSGGGHKSTKHHKP